MGPRNVNSSPSWITSSRTATHQYNGHWFVHDFTSGSHLKRLFLTQFLSRFCAANTMCYKQCWLPTDEATASRFKTGAHLLNHQVTIVLWWRWWWWWRRRHWRWHNSNNTRHNKIKYKNEIYTTLTAHKHSTPKQCKKSSEYSVTY